MRITSLEIYTSESYSIKKDNFLTFSIVNFNIKENKLTIPREYYDILIRNYKLEKRKNSSLKYKDFYKMCNIVGEAIYCNCTSRKEFGKITFVFGNQSRLDITLRNYVHYDRLALFYKCRADIVLSDNDEFVLGLRGLNNAILSFNVEEKKIKFFRQKAKTSVRWFIITLAVIGILICIIWLVFYF